MASNGGHTGRMSPRQPGGVRRPTQLPLLGGRIRIVPCPAPSAPTRNAAYLTSPAAKHLVTAIATAENIHIERKDAHQLDTIVREIPSESPDRPSLTALTFLEAYATSFRYGTPTGRVPAAPWSDRGGDARAIIEALIASLEAHVHVDGTNGGASHRGPRR